MTTANELRLLAERCEAAAGPDRELDAIIWLHLPEQEGHAWKHGGDKFAHAKQIAGCAFIPSFTASLDAAMTLDRPSIKQFGGPLAMLREAMERLFRDKQPDAALPRYLAAAFLRTQATKGE